MKEKRVKQKENGMVKEAYSVWIHARKKIAAFHAEAGYEKQIFARHAEFMEYLQELSQKHYRFK